MAFLLAMDHCNYGNFGVDGPDVLEVKYAGDISLGYRHYVIFYGTEQVLSPLGIGLFYTSFELSGFILYCGQLREHGDIKMISGWQYHNIFVDKPHKCSACWMRKVFSTRCTASA